VNYSSETEPIELLTDSTTDIREHM